MTFARRLSRRSQGLELDISHESSQVILQYHMGMSKILARIVPTGLCIEQTQTIFNVFGIDYERLYLRLVIHAKSVHTVCLLIMISAARQVVYEA